jgi:hypothetical protein
MVVADCCADSDPEVHRVLTEKVFPRAGPRGDDGGGGRQKPARLEAGGMLRA